MRELREPIRPSAKKVAEKALIKTNKLKILNYQSETVAFIGVLGNMIISQQKLHFHFGTQSTPDSLRKRVSIRVSYRTIWESNNHI